MSAMIDYRYDEQQAALKAWLSDPASEGGVEFFRKFLVDYHTKLAELAQGLPGTRTAYENHIAFKKAMKEVVVDATAKDNDFYTVAQKSAIGTQVGMAVKHRKDEKEAGYYEDVVDFAIFMGHHLVSLLGGDFPVSLRNNDGSISSLTLAELVDMTASASEGGSSSSASGQ